MKGDILEQLVDEYLQFNGYFTKHNIKFKPSSSDPEYDAKLDSVPSDIDVIGINPNFNGRKKVIVVSCKSWQKGFNPAARIRQLEENKIVSGREAWKGFRELVNDKWARAFLESVKSTTGYSRFTYVTAVTKINGDKSVWENYAPFRKRIDNPVRLISFETILEEIYSQINSTPASSQVGRVLQLIRASGWK